MNEAYDLTETVRIRKLTPACTELIDHLTEHWADCTIVTGRTYVEGRRIDLIDLAKDIRHEEPWFDFNSDNEAFYNHLYERAVNARVTWSKRIHSGAMKNEKKK
jgi:hypothetical protein